MKKFLILSAAATAFSCSDKQAQQQQDSVDNQPTVQQELSSSATAEPSTAKTTSSESATESSSSISNAFDAKVFEKIQTFYTNYIFGRQEATDAVIAKYCTKALAKKLRDAYDKEFSDGGGYAIWKFRSNAQDGEDIQEIEKIEPIKKNKYRIHYNDMGNKGTLTITIVQQNGDILFDKIN